MIKYLDSIQTFAEKINQSYDKNDSKEKEERKSEEPIFSNYHVLENYYKTDEEDDTLTFKSQGDENEEILSRFLLNKKRRLIRQCFKFWRNTTIDDPISIRLSDMLR